MTQQQWRHQDGDMQIDVPNVHTAKVVAAQGQAQENLARILLGGAVTIIVTIAAVVGTLMHNEGAQALVPLASVGLGYLMGRERSKH